MRFSSTASIAALMAIATAIAVPIAEKNEAKRSNSMYSVLRTQIKMKRACMANVRGAVSMNKRCDQDAYIRCIEPCFSMPCLPGSPPPNCHRTCVDVCADIHNC